MCIRFSSQSALNLIHCFANSRHAKEFTKERVRHRASRKKAEKVHSKQRKFCDSVGYYLQHCCHPLFLVPRKWEVSPQFGWWTWIWSNWLRYAGPFGALEHCHRVCVAYSSSRIIAGHEFDLLGSYRMVLTHSRSKSSRISREVFCVVARNLQRSICWWSFINRA